MRVRTASLLVLAAASAGFAAQIEIPDWDNSVRFELVASQSPVRPGDAFELALVAEIVEGYHLYGPEEIEPSRTEVELSGEALEAGEPMFPPVITRELEGLGEYDLYEGKIAIRVPVTLNEAAVTGKSTKASLTVRYQVCTDFACSAPNADELTIELPTGAPGDATKSLHADIFK